MEKKTPIFVKIDDYKDIIDIVTLLRKKINSAKDILGSINNLKSEEDAEIEQWNSNLEEIERKVEFIDRSLYD